MRVLICGGGVIGAAVAWYLARRGVRPVVVERTGVACAASGKSGGFLARCWCDGGPLAALAQRSFDLHAMLPAQIDADWGYRPVTTYAGHVGHQTGLDPDSAHRPVDWLSPEVLINQRIGTPTDTAQVTPADFTRALMDDAIRQGAELRIGEVTGLLRRGNTVVGAEVDGAGVEADAVVVAMGPWSILATQWLSLPGVYGLKGHSLVFATGGRLPAESLFLEVQQASGAAHSPEVFPRPDGTTYICAISSESPLPIDPRHIAPDPGAIEQLEAMCRRLSPVLADAQILVRQACFRPVTQDGLPLIGPVPGTKGAFVATGHSVWGILNAPATGEALSELILDGDTNAVDLTAFDPSRMGSFDPGTLLG